MATKGGPILLLGALAAMLLLKKKKDDGSKVKEKGEGPCDPGWTEIDGDCILMEEDQPTPTPPPGPPDDEDAINKWKKSAKKTGTKTPPGSLTEDALWVSALCDNAVFGDKTGEAWWKAWGKPIAKKWVDKGWKDPMQIAAGMLFDYAPNCTVLFPTSEAMKDRIEWEYNVDSFFKAYPKVYWLIQWVSNKIDTSFFGAKNSVLISSDCKTIDVGKEWWEKTGQYEAAYYIMLEEGDFGGVPGRSWWGAAHDKGMVIWNAASAILYRHDTSALFLPDEDKTCGELTGEILSSTGLSGLQQKLPNQLFQFLTYLEDETSQVLDELEGSAIEFNPNVHS